MPALPQQHVHKQVTSVWERLEHDLSINSNTLCEHKTHSDQLRKGSQFAVHNEAIDFVVQWYRDGRSSRSLLTLPHLRSAQSNEGDDLFLNASSSVTGYLGT